MKKISLVFVGVLFCTLVFARGTKGLASTSSVAVTNTSGSTLFKLYYKSEKANTVRVSIKNDIGQSVFVETMKKMDGFIRPYNFDGLPEGEYSMTVEDENGKTVEKINYKNNVVEKLIHIAKLTNESDRYLLTISSPAPENVFIYFFDANGNLAYNEIQTIHKEFGQVYNLKEMKSFRVEVWDKNGLVKSVNY